MRTGHKPNAPRSPLGQLLPQSVDVDQLKRDAWAKHRILVVHVDDQRVGWVEKMLLEQLAAKLFGRKGSHGET